MNHFRPYTTILVLLVMSIFMSACSAPVAGPQIADLQTYSIGAGTVLNGIARVRAGMPGTDVLQNGTKWIFVWVTPSSKVVALFGVDIATSTAVDVVKVIRSGGQMVNLQTAEDLIAFFKDNGWVSVSPSTIPPIITSTVNAIAQGRTIFIPMFVPAGVLDYPSVEELLQPDGGQS